MFLVTVDFDLLKKTSIVFIILVISFLLIQYILRKIGKDPRYYLPTHFAKNVKIPLVLFLLGTFLQFTIVKDFFGDLNFTYTNQISTLLFILSVTWTLIVFLKVLKNKILRSYDIQKKNNLKARKILTQLNILERISIFIIIVLAIGIALMSFDSIKSVGVSVLTSAGLAGIIVGFSAQKALGTLLAGIQIAFTQPIRLDDVVIVEGEWGTIEEITLTYVVIKIWDKRRLVVPTTYFIEKPFQNWTRTTSDILGTVFIYTDYKMNIDALRTQLTHILKNTELWDGDVNVLQVTNANKDAVEVRALMSAKDSPTAWDLRVHVREELIKFIQKEYPESIPRTRIKLDNPDKEF